MVFNAGELSIIEYGINEVIGTCRTENVHPKSSKANCDFDPLKISFISLLVEAYRLFNLLQLEVKMKPKSDTVKIKIKTGIGYY